MPIDDSKLRLEIARRAYLMDPPAKGTECPTVNAWAARYYRVLGFASVDALRNAINRMKSRKGGIEAPIEGVEVPFVPPSIEQMEEQVQKLQEELTKATDMRTAFQETLAAVIVPFEPVIPLNPEKWHGESKQEEIAIALLSDFQGGTWVPEEAVSGVTRGHSWETLEQEVASYNEHFLDVLDVITSGGRHIRKLIAAVLGDLIEGEGIYKGQPFWIDTRLMRQILKMSIIISRILLMYASVIEEIEVYFQNGNHGKVYDTTLNLDYIVGIFVAMELRNNPRIKVYLSQSPFTGIALPAADGGEFKILMAHGDNIPRYLQMPYYGIERAQQKWVNLTGIPWDVIFMGHHHQPSELEGDKFVNGCWVPATDYTVGKLRVANRCCQWLLFYHPEVGLTSRWPIYLQPKPGLKGHDDKGIYTPYQTLSEPDAQGLVHILDHFPGREIAEVKE